MSDCNYPIAITASEVDPRAKKSIYPEPFASRMEGKEKRILGDLFGLKNFGVNLTRLKPSASSALRHAHTTQDEFIYVLQGCPTLITNEGSQQLAPGMCAGFPAGSGNAHHLINNTNEEVVYLEIGDRTSGDVVTYPDDDLQAMLVDGKWQFTHKDGQPY
ncbi:cupin domain-containing protein [Aerosakkonemataceae cyanobacterium BLCC-F50]|uniref:Cupin domain-containing protein n=1 Tax=Floridaenema flaviceps BLCC-F50 TaxID=3153642 RepID=A0ABV4XSI1_9CYAN